MLEEMNQNHTHAEDSIHNWLCEQNDDELFKGILKEGKSIRLSMKYCMGQATKQMVNNCAMIDNQTVFEWVKEYFIRDDIKVDNNISAKVTTTSRPKTNKKSISKEHEQLDLFDFL